MKTIIEMAMLSHKGESTLQLVQKARQKGAQCLRKSALNLAKGVAGQGQGAHAIN